MLKPSRHKRGAKDDKLAHINFDATECQGFKEMMDKEEKLRLIAENGLVKHKRCRNPVLAESTVASSRTSSTATASSDYSSSSRRHGPEVDEDDDDGHGTSRQKSGRPPHHHHRQGASSRKSAGQASGLMTPRGVTGRSEGEAGSSKGWAAKASSGSRAHSDDKARGHGGGSGSSRRPATASGSGGSSLASSRATDDLLQRPQEPDLPLIHDLRLLPLACARPRELLKVTTLKEDFEGLRARRAERFLADAHARQQRQQQRRGSNQREGLEDEEEGWGSSDLTSGRTATSSTLSSSRPRTAPSIRSGSTERSMVERFGPAARGLPRGGLWKCVRVKSDLLQSKSQLVTPWALHYYAPTEPTDGPEEGPAHHGNSSSRRKTGRSKDSHGHGDHLDEQRDRLMRKLQKRMGVILAQLSDVNVKLDCLQKEVGRRAVPLRRQPHFLVTTKANEGRRVQQHHSLSGPHSRPFVL